jgi:hypothetical protein
MAIRTRITPAVRLPSLAPRLELTTGAIGILATLYFARMLALQGFTTKLEGLVGLIVFTALAVGFIAVPWLMVAGAIPFFALIPALKIFITPLVGGLKDVIVFAAVAASCVLALQRRAARRPAPIDHVVLALMGGVFVLYLVNVGGLISGETGHNNPWFQGVRLINEPLSMCFVGFTLREPRRVLAAARTSLLLTAGGMALVGLAQQVLGVNRLVQYGYTYGTNVRQLGSHLRSFGTLDDPFVYASFLLLGLAILAASPRLLARHWALLGLLSAGLLVSYVRTAAVVALALLGVALARRGRSAAAAFIVLIAITAAAATLISASDQAQTQTVAVNPTTYLTLNGRTKLWESQLGHSSKWPFGRGVGAVGSAAARAERSLSGKVVIGPARSGTTVVDSGYLTLIADVGLLGLAVFLVLLSRLVSLARRAVAIGVEAGWLVIAVVSVFALDALSREAFTSYPSSYFTWLLLGLGGAVCVTERRSRGMSPV